MKVLIACIFSLLFFGCRNANNNNPTPGATISKVSMRYDGVLWESTQTFEPINPVAYNEMHSSFIADRWLTTFNAVNSANNIFQFQFFDSAKIQMRSYPANYLAGLIIDNKKYYAGDGVNSYLNVTFTSITLNSVSGTFSGRFLEMSNGAAVGYIDITEGRFDNIKYLY